MQRSGNFQHQLTSPEALLKSTFSVVIAYQDLESGKNARRTYDHITHQLGDDCQFTNEMWNFDVLGIPRLRELAARDASRADMIIIACHGDKPLPDTVKNWIEIWMTEEAKSIALVALFDAAQMSSGPAQEVREYLAEIAHRSNMEFFSQTEPWPDRNTAGGLLPAPSTRLPIEPNNPLAASLGFRQRHEAFPHWGINE
jgi:hypothetical protein